MPAQPSCNGDATPPEWRIRYLVRHGAWGPVARVSQRDPPAPTRIDTVARPSSSVPAWAPLQAEPLNLEPLNLAPGTTRAAFGDGLDPEGSSPR